MRVTNAMSSGMIQRQMAQNSSRLSDLQNDVASGVRIHNPSDDPSGAVQVAQLNSGLAQVSQYQSSVTMASNYLKQEDSALGNITSLVQQIRTQALQAGNSQSTTSDNAIATQLQTLRAALLTSVNVKDATGTRYLFSGYQLGAQPFQSQSGGVQYAGDDGKITLAIGTTQTLSLNTTGAEVAGIGAEGQAGVPDLFATVDQLVSHVQAGDKTAVQTDLQNIDTHLTQITALQARTGDREQQATFATNQLSASHDALTACLSDTQDTDMAQAIVSLQQQQNVLQASSYVATSISQGGLLQYLH